jgi:hypothetical protein
VAQIKPAYAALDFSPTQDYFWCWPRFWLTDGLGLGLLDPGCFLHPPIFTTLFILHPPVMT